LLGLGIASFCGVTYLFGGFGMVKTYDPIKAEIVDWSPIGNMLTPKSYKLKIRLVSEFYEKYPDTKVTKLTSQDVLDELEKYCTARTVRSLILRSEGELKP
jgi:DNA-directed RNA polymerase subunit N (RpoN/RPB10)